jgi:hypothetical protein
MRNGGVVLAYLAYLIDMQTGREYTRNRGVTEPNRY